MTNIEQRIAELESELKALKDKLAKPVKQPDPLRVAFEKAKALCGGGFYWYINEYHLALTKLVEDSGAFGGFRNGNFFVSREAAEQAMHNGKWREIASCSIRNDYKEGTKVCEIAVGLDRVATLANRVDQNV